jgi:hypothetical protein
MQTCVSGLYVHGPKESRPGDTTPTPMIAVQSVRAVEGMGLEEDPRYFHARRDGRERLRQVSLIDEGTIQRHEQWFGPIERAYIKAQIILAGDVFLPDLLGQRLRFASGAELTLTIYRQPCFEMDLIAAGLREAMQGRQQGALAKVTLTGTIRLGDIVTLVDCATLSGSVPSVCLG